MRLRVWSLAVVAIAATPSRVVHAEPARAGLVYLRKDTAAASCPDEPTFRSLVASRLGYDPFESGGPQTLTVELRPQGREIVGRLTLVGEGGDRRGERTLRSGDTDCFELASSMSLAAAFALDPEAVRARAAPAPVPPTPPAPPASAPPPSPPPTAPAVPPDRGPSPPPPARSTVGFRGDIGFVLPVGIVPEPRGGVRAGAALDGGAWSIGAEGAFLFPSVEGGSSGEVSAKAVYGSIVPCAHPRLGDAVLVDLCVVGSAGAMFSDAAGVSRSRPLTDFVAMVAPRAGVTVLPWSSVGFAAAFDMPVALSRVHLFIDDGGQRREVWASSRLGFIGGLALVVRLR